MEFLASEIAAATGGRLHGSDVPVVGASIDSRSIEPGRLFVPVVAARDGHDFVGAAVNQGAAAYLTDRGPLPGLTAPAIEVRDTAAALADLGRAARARVTDRVVGVTGSVGKTSTKDLLAATLATTYLTTASEKSFNNELGLPLTLVNAPSGTEAVVLEMGARGIGHIAELCSIATPTVGVITRVEAAHLAMFGDIGGVASAKGELIEALPTETGIAVLNADHPLVVAMAGRTGARVLFYGLQTGEVPVDVTAEDVVLGDDLRAHFTLRTPWGATEVRLNARGAHQVPNALATAAAAGGLGVPVERIAEGLATSELSGLRMELVTVASGATVINDAYNANPASMSAALQSLAALPAARRFAVLGTMAELGADSDAEHRRISSLAHELGVEVIAVDEQAYGPTVRQVSGVTGALDALGDLGEGDAVLVKGSRVAALERVVDELTA